jgi:hypothetical protein
MAEFQWWLLILGLVIGAGIAVTALADGARRDEDVEADERPAEADWIVDRLTDEGRSADPATVESILLAHRDYRRLPPPDRLEA